MGKTERGRSGTEEGAGKEKRGGYTKERQRGRKESKAEVLRKRVKAGNHFINCDDLCTL